MISRFLQHPDAHHPRAGDVQPAAAASVLVGSRPASPRSLVDEPCRLMFARLGDASRGATKQRRALDLQV